ncbi:MAG: VOC family protein [Bacteroidetes bacterium]|nr:VOC family protein [Bacteroidota bacterium]
MVNFTQIKETGIYVMDLERTKAFYHGLLNLDIISEESGRHIFFRVGTSVLLCFIAEATKMDKELPAHYGTGEQHYAFEVNQEDYEKCKSEFNKLGIAIEKEVTWNGARSFYFRDPDNHLGEVVMEKMWD